MEPIAMSRLVDAEAEAVKLNVGEHSESQDQDQVNGRSMGEGFALMSS